MNIIDNRNLLTQRSAAIVVQKKTDELICSWRLYPSINSLVVEVKSLQSQSQNKSKWSRCYMIRFACKNAFSIFINRFGYYPAATMEAWAINETNDCILTYEHMYDENT